MATTPNPASRQGAASLRACSDRPAAPLKNQGSCMHGCPFMGWLGRQRPPACCARLPHQSGESEPGQQQAKSQTGLWCVCCHRFSAWQEASGGGCVERRRRRRWGGPACRTDRRRRACNCCIRRCPYCPHSSSGAGPASGACSPRELELWHPGRLSRLCMRPRSAGCSAPSGSRCVVAHGCTCGRSSLGERCY